MESKRWTVVIPGETDRAVRMHLARTGGRKGDLSKLVDEAVKRYVFEETVERVKAQNESQDQDEIMKAIDESVDAVRANRP